MSARPDPYGSLVQEFYEFRPCEHEILVAFGFMALKAFFNVGPRIPTPIGQKTRVLLFAVSKVFRVLDTPTGTLFHYDDPVQGTPD